MEKLIFKFIAIILVLGASALSVFAGDKVTICHATGSASNPFVTITISVNALPAHMGDDQHAGHGDSLGACPTGSTETPEPTTEVPSTPTQVVTEEPTTVVTETPNGGGNGGSTETDDDQGETQDPPLATEPVRDFIPLPAEACDASDVILNISYEIHRGFRINKVESTVVYDITPSELEGTEIVDIEVVNACVVAVVADSNLYTMGMDGSNLQPIMATDTNGYDYQIQGTEISVGNNSVIWFRNMDGEIAKTDASGSIDEGLNAYGRGISVSPDGQTIAYTDGNDNVKIISVYGRNILNESAGNQAIATYWSPNGQFLFSFDQGCQAVAFDLVNKKEIPVGNICNVSMNPNGEIDTLLSDGRSILNATVTSNGVQIFSGAYLPVQTFTVPLISWSFDTERFEQVERWDINWVIPYDSVTLVTQAFGN